MSRPVPMVRPRSAASIEQIALDILSTHGEQTLAGEAPFDVISFADGPLEKICGIDFEVQDLGPNVEGRFENRTLILNTSVYEGAIRWKNRDRFTTSHECGHAVLHSDELDVINEWNRGQPTLYRRDEIKAYRDPEWQANRFAAALLMPIPGVQVVLSKGRCLGEKFAAMRVASAFRVSQIAAETRVKKLLEGGFVSI